VTGNNRTGVAVVMLAALSLGTALISADTAALKLRATAIGAGPSSPLTVELFRWSTDAERAPVHAAFSAPPPAPAAPAAAAAGRGRAGRGGGRGNAAPPISPEARIAAAIKAAPTFGYIWGDAATGYSIKYAWRSSSTGGAERIVLVTDRRLGSHAAPLKSAPGAASEQDYTVVEMRIDAKGSGEGKTSLSTRVVMDATTNTLALDGYAAAPAELKVTR
jgi:hypothetical protein